MLQVKRKYRDNTVFIPFKKGASKKTTKDITLAIVSFTTGSQPFPRSIYPSDEVTPFLPLFPSQQLFPRYPLHFNHFNHPSSPS